MEDLEDHEFEQRFRFSKETATSILDMISNDIAVFSGQEGKIPPMLQLLTSLRFFACGSFQSVTGDLLDISQASVRILGKLSRAIAAHHQEFIKFPTPNEIQWRLNFRLQKVHLMCTWGARHL